VVTRTRLMKALWDDERFVDDNTLTVNVNRLRRKLETAGLKDYIKTVKGEGHRLI
jgi:DNA-binding response OmpR family regulator